MEITYEQVMQVIHKCERDFSFGFSLEGLKWDATFQSIGIMMRYAKENYRIHPGYGWLSTLFDELIDMLMWETIPSAEDYEVIDDDLTQIKNFFMKERPQD